MGKGTKTATVSHDGNGVVVEGLTKEGAEDERNGFSEIGWALRAVDGGNDPLTRYKVEVQGSGADGMWRWQGTVRPAPVDGCANVAQRLRDEGWVVEGA